MAFKDWFDLLDAEPTLAELEERNNVNMVEVTMDELLDLVEGNPIKRAEGEDNRSETDGRTDSEVSEDVD